MRKKIKRLPSNARYSYTDIYGNQVYHTESRRYEVGTDSRWGHKAGTIYSEPITQ